MPDSRDQENLALRQFDKRQIDERQLAKIQVVNRQALGGSFIRLCTKQEINDLAEQLVNFVVLRTSYHHSLRWHMAVT